MVVLNLRDDCVMRTATNFGRGMTDKRFLELEITAWLHSKERQRQLAGEAVVHGGADAVHIGPGTLALAAVLLRGGKALLHGKGHGLIVGGIPGVAEIDEPDGAILQHHDIVRADISMYNTCIMNLIQ